MSLVNGRIEPWEVLRRWDWVLVAVIAPVMLFPQARFAWALLVLPVILILQWLAWGEILPVTPLNPAILLLVVMVAGSIYVTPDLLGSLGKIVGLIYGIIVYFCTARHTRTQEGWRGSLILFTLTGTGIALLGFLGTKWTTLKFTWLNPLTSRLPAVISDLPGAESGIHPNELAGALLWVVPVIILAILAMFSKPGWFAYRKDKTEQDIGKYILWAVFLVFATLMTIGALILTQSRGSYLAIALTGIVLLVLLLKGSIRWWIAGLIITAGIIGMIIIGQIGMQTVTDQVTSSLPMDASVFSMNTWSARVEILSRAIWAIRDTPLTGLGMNVFRNAIQILYPTFRTTSNYSMGHAHNELLQAALDLGLPGLIAFLALYIGALGMLAKSIRAAGTWHVLALGLLGGLTAHFLYGITDAVALGAKPGFVFWWLIGMAFGMYDQNRMDKKKKPWTT